MPKEVKLKYKDIGTFDFAQTFQKIISTPMSNDSANHIRHINREIKRIRKEISDGYLKDIVEPFAIRSEDGKIKRDDGDVSEQTFTPMTDKEAEFKKAQDDFGDREAVVAWSPINPKHLIDVKLSAKELDSLHDLYSDDEGPGVPQGFSN